MIKWETTWGTCATPEVFQDRNKNKSWLYMPDMPALILKAQSVGETMARLNEIIRCGSMQLISKKSKFK